MEPSARFEEVEIPLREPVQDVDRVSGVLGIPEWWPTGSRIGVVIAHSQRSDHTDPQLVELHRSLTERKFLTLRFNFPFMEQGRRRVDAQAVSVSSIFAALTTATQAAPDLPLFLGGHSYGGRMASHAVLERTWTFAA